MNPALRRTLYSWSAFYLLFFGALLALHAQVLRLPYFWDELGQFIPAGLDILQLHAWVPKTTLPNVHPPGVMAYLASVWAIAGYSVMATRVAMLALAAFGVLATFVLAIELCRDLPGTPAIFAPLFLLCSPLFWAQSMMAQLDMPAMVFTCAGLWLFLRGRMLSCAICCTLLVLCKESSLAVPFVLGCWLLRERRIREALLFFIPAGALAVWLTVLHASTGHWLGNAEFTHYNVWFQLHPVRLPVTVFRRIFYLFVDNWHALGTLAIGLAWMRTRIFRNRAWALVATVALVQTIVVSVLGGAALERYLVPVIPLFYLAAAASLAVLAAPWRLLISTVITAGLLSAILINSPFAYPFENNAAFVSFVHLQQRAADYCAQELPDKTIVSAWPFPDALRRPEFGYVPRPMKVRGIDNFNPETVLALAGKVDVLVVYSRTWEPTWGVLRAGWIRWFLTEYYFYKPQIAPDQIEEKLGLSPVVRWDEGGQWIEIYVRNARRNLLVL
ncbi:MAG: hypothetical protein SGI92_13895 [Bryobacteraceae bacterium]|nr:hypothetical protein [Bryobacteraceae bacterium]